MMDKLYPPSIAGTLPSFYTTEEGTMVIVPFSMNKTVSIKQVKGFKLRIKTTNTDILYGTVDSLPGSWGKDDQITASVTFKLPETIKNKLSIGYYYKVQIAYVDSNDVIGYYSTVSIIKYTAKPSVTINDFSLGRINSYRSIYIGEYNSNDITEKVYQYKFDLYNHTDTLLESSGWQLHNSYEDTSLTASIDRYNIKYALNKNLVYKICYTVKTNNGLEVSSPRYLVMESNTINPEVDIKLIAALDYDNACIDLSFEGVERTITGSFLLARASSADNYSSWVDIADLKLIGELPSKFLFKDFAIEQGVTYVYSLQQYTDNKKIYSNKLLSNYVIAGFEDIYLYDGKKQLRIRFNSKVSSFKSIVQESKKVTLGGKYPIILRNGSVEYKEFPINGLISYYMDNDKLFFSIQNDLNITDWVPTTDIIDENIYIERKFKMAVLEWLNNGEVKLFKSPQEGNYIVRLMNVSLTPIDQTSRMLHNFSCTATEIADLTTENLIKFKLMKPTDIVTYQTRWETVVLEDLWMELRKLPEDERISIYEVDLLNGHQAYSIDFKDMRFGQKFSFIDKNANEHIFMIGATGAYSIQFEEPITNLKLINPRDPNNSSNGTLFENNAYYSENIPVQGTLTFNFKSTSSNTFDYITDLGMRDIPIHQVFGPDENILSYFNNFRRTISRIYYTRFTALEVRPIYDPLFGTSTGDGVYFTGTIQCLEESKNTQHISPIYNIPRISKNGTVVPNYYSFYQGKLYIEPHMQTVFPEVIELNEYTLYTDGTSYYKLYGDQLKNVTSWALNSGVITNTGKTRYKINQNDLTPYVIYEKHFMNSDKKEYFKYNGYELIKLSEYSTLIDYGGKTTFDLAEKKELYFTELDYVPEYIKIGSGVCAEIGMQIRDITYKVESLTSLRTPIQQYENALLDYYLKSLNYKELNYKDFKNMAQPTDIAIYQWIDHNFSIDNTQETWSQFIQGKVRLFTPILTIIPTITPPEGEFIPESYINNQKAIDNAYNELIAKENDLIRLIQEEIQREKEIKGDE